MKKTIITLLMITALVMSLSTMALANEKEYDLPNPPSSAGSPGDWQYWFTPGTDGTTDDYLPWWILSLSEGIVFEIPEEPESFELVYFGGFNGWGWTQVNVLEYWEDGLLTIMWDDIGFDVSAITADEDAVKIAIGNWDNAEIDRIYLLGVDGTEENPNPPLLDVIEDKVEDVVDAVEDKVEDVVDVVEEKYCAICGELEHLGECAKEEANTKFFGLDLWIWLVILGGVIVVIIIIVVATKKKG